MRQDICRSSHHLEGPTTISADVVRSRHQLTAVCFLCKQVPIETRRSAGVSEGIDAVNFEDGWAHGLDTLLRLLQKHDVTQSWDIESGRALAACLSDS